ncbi:phosphohistidine phosphatase SixA [Cyanobacterium stanieri LEGE 03274]|uniref:Phosphohistidine phosphatase SixA n=1 Tax=Cyanobacterium stanieri LEGE 03274 TaxID=1828756 RepID=A0ABR9V5P2_9CHRO|nr:phosphohistidine phosphatase SixA [Cyanobacterium stanieri]MBE9223211.1 phosphohistidine phosphatase SixA [Cyanobacterium stanieri LEGE 03274]
MKIYFVRHGIAQERIAGEDNPERALTPKGIAKTHQVAQKLKQVENCCNLIITSPYVRAKQTAEILYEHKIAPKIEERNYLMPDGDIQPWLHSLQNSSYSKDDKLILVGHQPDLGNWAETLIWGKSAKKITLKKAGIIGINIFDIYNPLGNGEIFLLISPKWLLTTIDS